MHHHHPTRYVLFVLSVLLLIHAPANAQEAFPLSASSPATMVTTAQAAATATDPSLDFVGALGPIVETAAVSGSLAYVGENNSLAILDVSDPTQPIVLSRLPLSGAIKGMKVVGNLVYIANYSYGLQIVDVSDPIRPVLRGSIALEGNPSDVDVVGSRAYIPAYNYGLKIVDISDPSSPQLLGSSGSYGSITGVKVVDNVAYVAGLSGLIILDVSNPAGPAFMGMYNTASAGIGNAYNLDVADNLVYLADGGGGLQIVDVSSPTNPILRGSFGAARYALAVHVIGSLAYVASREFGLYVLDVSNPAAPYLRGRFDTPGAAYDIQIVGDRAYVADYTTGLQILDVAQPASPTVLGSYGIAGNTREAWIANNLAYIAAGSDGLRIIDVSTPARPLLRGSLAIPGWVYSVEVVGTHAYLGNWENGKLLIVDVQDPAHPLLLGSYQSAQRVMGLEIVGSLAYLADGGGGIEIVDISNGASPSLVGRLDTQSFARDIDVVGSTAYVASEYGGLKIVDVSDPTHPTLRSSVDIIAAEAVQVIDNLAYIAFGDCTTHDPPYEWGTCSGGLQILDVSNPVSPVVRGTYLSGVAHDIRVVSSRAYLAVDNHVHVLDVSDATSPRLLNIAPVQGQAEALQVEGDLIYVTGYLTGLEILSNTPEFVTSKITITSSGGQAASTDGTIQLQFEANTVTEPITILYMGQQLPTQTLPDQGSVVRRFITEAWTENGSAVPELNQPYTIVVGYTDAQLAALGIPEVNINLVFWDGTSWAQALPCAGCGVDTSTNRVTVRVRRFTQFALVDGQSPTPISPPLPTATITPHGGSVASSDCRETNKLGQWVC